jgi:hypothetical protein
MKPNRYGFIYYEENLKNNNLFICSFNRDWVHTGTSQLTE